MWRKGEKEVEENFFEVKLVEGGRGWEKKIKREEGDEDWEEFV